MPSSAVPFKLSSYLLFNNVRLSEQIKPGDELRTRLEKVVLLDNQTLETIREIPIEEEIRRSGTDLHNIHVTLDRDVLLIRVKSSIKSTTFLYRLVLQVRLHFGDNCMKIKNTLLFPDSKPWMRRPPFPKNPSL